MGVRPGHRPGRPAAGGDLRRARRARRAPDRSRRCAGEGRRDPHRGSPGRGDRAEPAVPAREPMPGRGDLRHPRGRTARARRPGRPTARGSSMGPQGSPVFNPAGEAVAMVTTTTIGATQETACALGLPCQVSDDGGISVKEDTSYMVPVAALAACFAEGTLHPRRGLCPGGSGVGGPGPRGRVGRQAGVDRGDPARGGPARGVRVDGRDRGEAGQVGHGGLQRRRRAGWVPRRLRLLAAAEAGVGDAACLAGTPSPAASAGQRRPRGVGRARSASPAAGARRGLGRGRPRRPAGAVVLPGHPPHRRGLHPGVRRVGRAAHRDRDQGRRHRTGSGHDRADHHDGRGWRPGGAGVRPARSSAQFRWVSGPVDSIDCATAEGYVEYRRVPATIQAADLPSTVCVIGIDEAGNESKPAAITVE